MFFNDLRSLNNMLESIKLNR